ncbi:MAG: hypothetical protein JXO72_07935 [Vicinamibacteria bacterium]|nr:hypothetical protein [Vicinamibacteria bacterium]
MPKTVSTIFSMIVLVFLSGCSEQVPLNPVAPSTPTPTPTPIPTPTPYVPPEPGEASCDETEPLFAGIVFSSINQVLEENPEWFDHESMQDWVIAKEPEKFLESVLDKINAQPPHKAAPGWFFPWAVISVKTNNRRSEDYHLMTSSNAVRWFYGQTCSPATF